ncbi:MAG: PIN domain-containing protein [Armatimonadetes bacterium]|nr:PIN domain-containing protein [Armatimonadota bacterium]
MPSEPLVFLDTSAHFAAVFSAQGGGRAILRIGESGAVRLVVCAQVLREVEDVFRRKAPARLGVLAAMLTRAGVLGIDDGEVQAVEPLVVLTKHPPDAIVLEAALRCGADYLVTLDRRHLLVLDGRAEIELLRIGTPGDFLAWYRASLPPEP